MNPKSMAIRKWCIPYRGSQYTNESNQIVIDLKSIVNPPANPLTEEPQNLELKVLPSHLKYSFFGASKLGNLPYFQIRSGVDFLGVFR